MFDEFGVLIVRCRACRHVFSTHVSDPHYDGFWKDEVASPDQAYWNDARTRMYKAFLTRFVAGRSGRLLDMGCGLGFFAKAAAEYQSWEVCGCEISSAAAHFARETLGLAQIRCARLEQADWPPEFFDIITLWDVLDHLSRPDPLLAHCHRLLKRGGLCFIRTPNVVVHLPRARLKKLVRGMRNDLTYLQARDHVHHYSTSSLRALLARNGFSSIEFTHLPPVDSILRRSAIARRVRQLSFDVVCGLAAATGGRLNLDNLFAVARA